MNNQPYQGAYSRRRFSNYSLDANSHVETHDTSAVKTSVLKVSWNGTQGRVTGSGNFQIDAEAPACQASAKVVTGNTVTLVATPNAGYHFEGWRGMPVSGVTDKSVTVKMMQDYNVSAVFAPDMPGEHHDLGGDHDHDAEKPNVYQYKPQGGIVDQVKPFVKKWWWAILIVAYIAYKEWKGARQ